MGDQPSLPFQVEDWITGARDAARNLGFGELRTLPPEQWQKVIASLGAKMSLKGMTPPAGWDEDLAEQVGRVEP
ncbi:hypothetical protein [Methylobacterium sp. ID0610]|uniref:hypothetical protein n=1 Tax=Methylobacterium carpenticola TaxID=3344827 RepID=UPI003692D666